MTLDTSEAKVKIEENYGELEVEIHSKRKSKQILF